MDFITWWLWMLTAIVLLCGGTSILTIVFMQTRHAKTTGGADDYADMCRNERAKVMKDLARYDDTEYVMAKPQKPIVVMRREPGAKWQIVEDNR